jgi:uncharacterized integral membrane protein
MIEKVRIIATILFVAVILIVAVQNTYMVIFQFFVWDFALSLSLLLFFVFVIGVLSGGLFTTFLEKAGCEGASVQ